MVHFLCFSRWEDHIYEHMEGNLSLTFYTDIWNLIWIVTISFQIRIFGLTTVPLNSIHREMLNLLALCTKYRLPYMCTGCPFCSWSWVGQTLIWVPQHLAQLQWNFCQIPISPGRIGQTVEHPKSKSTHTVHGQMGHPVLASRNCEET